LTLRMLLNGNLVFILCWVCARQCPYPQDRSLNWIYGALIKYNCAELPAGRRNCSSEYWEPWTELEVSYESPADVLSKRGTCDVGSHVASCSRSQKREALYSRE